MAYSEPEGEPATQQQIETVHQSHESCDEYQNSYIFDQSELDIEPDAEDNDVPDDNTGLGHYHPSQTADK